MIPDAFEVPCKPSLTARARAVLPKRRAADGQLSPNFDVREFDCKDGTKVPSAAVPALTGLCKDVLEPLRTQFGGCTVHSGYRTVTYNRKIGGARFSQHIYDQHPSSVAADVSFKTGTPQQWGFAAAKILNGRGGLGVYPSSGFIHCDNRPGPAARWSG